MDTAYTYLCTWADSTVFRKWETVLKLYRDLSVEALVEYHELQSYIARRVREELDGEIRMPSNFSWQGKSLGHVWIKVVWLTKEMVHSRPLDFSHAKFYKWDGTELVGYVPPSYTSVSQIPNVWGNELHEYIHTPSWKLLLREISGQLEDLWIPVVGTDIYTGLLHPINIKVLPYQWWLDLLITDIGASIRATLAAFKKPI